MATKRARKSGKKVKNLRAKSLSGKKAKGVKGGIIAVLSPTKGTIEYTPPAQTKWLKQ